MVSYHTVVVMGMARTDQSELRIKVHLKIKRLYVANNSVLLRAIFKMLSACIVYDKNVCL